MSSHHIVRDNQEPALLILQADLVSFEIIQELLEWSPLIIVHESQLDIVLNWGIKIDMILVAETKKEKVIEQAASQFPLRLLSYREGEDGVDKMLHFLQAGNFPSVNVVTNDTAIFHRLLHFESKMNVVVIQDDVRWSLVRSGYFEKRLAEEAKIYKRTSDVVSEINTEGRNKVTINHPESFWVGEEL